MHSTFLLPLLAGLAASQPTTTTSDIPADVNSTPDALDLAFLRDVPAPTYTTIEGALSQDVPYATAEAIQSAAAVVSETPLSQFPAVSTVAINAAGDSDSAATATTTPVAARRDFASPIEKRAACDPQATIANYYSVDVSSYQAFKDSSIIAQVANNAQTPAGYSQAFKNLQAANSAYAYMGYTVLQTGYDVNSCAQECDNKEGCLAFNIYFERDPVVEPGTGCNNPNAFANIKCSFWGGALDATTATNDGQWRAGFQVAIAGSNAYTSDRIGPNIDGWDEPLRLGNAAMNAPLRDCAGTWTYMGYKLFDGPFDVNKCAAACDAQTDYNVAHPPSSGYVPLCAAFGTYLLTKTTSSGSVIQGQMCTMYTSGWDAQYAVNTASYDDSIGAKYTYSYSYFYSKPVNQPVCDSDLNYLKSVGSDFCSSYISYVPSTSTSTSTTVPGVSTVYQTTAVPTTVTVYTSTAIVTGQAGVAKRSDAASAADSAYSIDVVTSSVLLPSKSVSNGTFTPARMAKRSVPTPASITAWPAAKISGACSNVATGVVTATSITTAPVPLTTAVVTTTTTVTVQTVSTLTIPAVILASPTSIVSGRQTSSDDNYYTLTLPFAISAYGVSSNTVILTDNSVLYWPSSNTGLNVGYAYTNQPLPWNGGAFFGDAALFGLWDDLYIYQGTDQGIYYAVSGSVGSRQVVFEFYSSAYMRSTEFYHFTMTMYENQPGIAIFKYYTVYQNGYSATVGAQRNGGNYVQYSYNSGVITPGLMLTVDTNTNTITRGSFSV